MDKQYITTAIKRQAARFGFAACGVARADFLQQDAMRFEHWLAHGMHGEMAYMADHLDMRLDPAQLMPGAKSVVSLAYNYFRPQNDPPASPYLISMYAQGRDYHRVLRRKLREMIAAIRHEVGEFEARVCIDSAPITEKTWAAEAGLGWIGKNSLLVMPRAGSYHFLAELVVDIELHYDSPMGDHCGVCRECVDACPTGAIIEPYVVDARKCISYMTIEMKSDIPEAMAGRYSGWIFGCDICQQVCPFNRFAAPHDEPQFEPRPEISMMTAEQWHQLTPERFEDLFAGTPVMRAKYDRLMRNIRFLSGT